MKHVIIIIKSGHDIPELIQVTYVIHCWSRNNYKSTTFYSYDTGYSHIYDCSHNILVIIINHFKL